jgi:hypothetical protein
VRPPIESAPVDNTARTVQPTASKPASAADASPRRDTTTGQSNPAVTAEPPRHTPPTAAPTPDPRSAPADHDMLRLSDDSLSLGHTSVAPSPAASVPAGADRPSARNGAPIAPAEPSNGQANVAHGPRSADPRWLT